MKFNGIQLLRFLAATVVVAFHGVGIGEKYFIGGHAHWTEIFRHGDYGVDLFFVISGFVISYTLGQKHLTPAKFITRRFERIYPLYLFFTLLMLVLVSVFSNYMNGAADTRINRIATSLTFTSFLTGKSPIVYVGWSLEYEMFFYVSVFISLIFRRAFKVLLIPVLSAFVFLGVMFNDSESTLFRFLTNPMILEFLLGVLIGWLVLSGRLQIFGLLAVTLSLVAVAISNPTSRVIVAGLPSVLLVVLAIYFERLFSHLPAVGRLFVRLGDASYSIYLMQVISLPALAKVLAKVMPGISVDAFTVLSCLCTLVAGYMLYRLVERPLTKGTRISIRWLEGRRAIGSA